MFVVFVIARSLLAYRLFRQCEIIGFSFAWSFYHILRQYYMLDGKYTEKNRPEHCKKDSSKKENEKPCWLCETFRSMGSSWENQVFSYKELIFTGRKSAIYQLHQGDSLTRGSKCSDGIILWADAGR